MNRSYAVRERDPADDRPASSAMTGIRLAELLGRVSLAFDIANGCPYGKAVRSVVLAVELGRHAGATDEELHDTFWVSLLGHLGCRGIAPHDRGEAERCEPFQCATRETSTELAEIAGAGPRVLTALREWWEGHGSPDCGARGALTLPMRLSQIGDSLETAHHQHGREGAVDLIRQGSGGPFEPSLRKVFIAEHSALFAAIEDAQIFHRFLAIEPKPAACANEHRLDDVTRALAIFADLRYPMFLGHSTGVAGLAERAAAELGLGEDDTRALRRAALLHDIGRLGVPASIWTRPGRLSWGEMESVRLHAYYTERVLSPIRVLGPVAEIASAAHERVDGSGYPQSRIARSLQPAARVLALADMAFAMSEARPYRAPLNRDAIARELLVEVGAGRADAASADAVLAVLGVKARTAPRNAHGISDRELEVCQLIARGKMNKEIAAVLGISLRTVQNHVTHIFDKLGMHSRSGVAVWLVENDFVQ
jgi:HD-GYP domain-containing protein (c-di-GMP phosphodiesterase class II)